MTREEAIETVRQLADGYDLAVACETMRRALDDLTAGDRRPGDDGDTGLFGIVLDVQPDATLTAAFTAAFASADVPALASARSTLAELSSPLRRGQ